MSSITYPKYSEIHTKEKGCGYCKFKSKYEWICTAIYSPMKGKPISYITNCQYFRRQTENRIR